jgi:hypothetical protein
VDEGTAAGLLERAPQCLAVDGHDFTVRETCHRYCHRRNASLSAFGSKAAKTRPIVSCEGIPHGALFTKATQTGEQKADLG